MIDPATIVAITAAVTVLGTECAKGVASAAGKSAWQSLQSLFKLSKVKDTDIGVEVTSKLQREPALADKAVNLLGNPAVGNAEVVFRSIKTNQVVFGDVATNMTKIENLIVVGSVLKDLQNAGSLPKGTDPSEFPTIHLAFEKYFQGPNVTQATAAVGAILKPIFSKFPTSENVGIPYKDILYALSRTLPDTLKSLNHWDGSDTFVYSGAAEWQHLPKGTSADVVWLESLQSLWEKHFKQPRTYGIATTNVVVDECPKSSEKFFTFDHEGRKRQAVPFFVIKQQNGKTTEALNPFNGSILGGELGRFNHKQFRVFMVGLTIDLIRILSESLGSGEILKQLISALSDQSPKLTHP